MITRPRPLPVHARAVTIFGLLTVLPALSCAGAARSTRPSSIVDSSRLAQRRSVSSAAGKRAGGRAVSYYQTGTATYYGKKFHGRRTASGERYDRRKFTAAHKTLPFGTMVRVTSMSNGKTVTVRVNDRGPLKGGRIIDLSFAAAKALDMISAGVVSVGIEIVGKSGRPRRKR
ncbi:MAG: septal ring lytic transglycosylase RlpA family protein [Chitinispirillaceae bacterium]|nr:septal ring lytic transglycosylase RlpA family protein [Chitinispirillaceae bacterium]